MIDVRRLVEGDDDAVETEWEASDDRQLDAAIEVYRTAIRSLMHPLPRNTDIKDTELTNGIPPHCIPILADVRTYNWSRLWKACQFDVIVMDPPWQLATSNPTRGVALTYSQLTNGDILDIPIRRLQSKGLLFLWTINSSFDFAMTLLEEWGYQLIDEIVWVKLTVNRRLAKSHGYYLQHAKEVCLVGVKGDVALCPTSEGMTDVVLSRRRGQSQKPDEIYDLVEALVPNGKYLEIFARKHNLRDFWVSLGNEVLGTAWEGRSSL